MKFAQMVSRTRGKTQIKNRLHKGRSNFPGSLGTLVVHNVVGLIHPSGWGEECNELESKEMKRGRNLYVPGCHRHGGMEVKMTLIVAADGIPVVSYNNTARGKLGL